MAVFSVARAGRRVCPAVMLSMALWAGFGSCSRYRVAKKPRYSVAETAKLMLIRILLGKGL